jgi:DNA polymerase-3 subunit delta
MMATKSNKESKQASGKQAAAKGRLHLICGSDEYLVAAKARELVDRLCPPENQAFGLEIIDGQLDVPGELAAAIRRCLEAVRTPGFLGGEKVVWLKGLRAFEVRESSELADAMEVLTELVRGGVPSGQVLVMTARKVDGRSAFYKACQAAGSVEVFDVPDKSWAEQQYAEQAAIAAFDRLGICMDEAALAEFLARVGADTWQISQEAEKLAVFLGARKNATAEDVRAITSATREAAVWDLAEAVGERDLPRALAALEQLLFQGENEVGIITLLESRLRDLGIFRWCMDKGWLNLRQSGGRTFANWASGGEVDATLCALPKDPRAGNPFYVAKLAAQASRFSADELLAAEQLILETHQRLFNSALPAQTVLEVMLIRLLGAPSETDARGRFRSF